jgi:hypothetical protein
MPDFTDAKFMEMLIGKEWAPEQAQAASAISAHAERFKRERARARRYGSRKVEVAAHRSERIFGPAYTREHFACVLRGAHT